MVKLTKDMLLNKIIAIIDEADAERPDENDLSDDANTLLVDVDFDAYQEIHKLLREQGLLKEA